MLKGHVIISTTLGMWLPISQKKTIRRGSKGRPEILMKTKNIKTILPSYSAIKF
jgi:hypothetical protein